jgi:hypothetical protein
MDVAKRWVGDDLSVLRTVDGAETAAAAAYMSTIGKENRLPTLIFRNCRFKAVPTMYGCRGRLRG